MSSFLLIFTIQIQTVLITNASMAEAERRAEARHQQLINTFDKLSVYGSSNQAGVLLPNTISTLIIHFLDRKHGIQVS